MNKLNINIAKAGQEIVIDWAGLPEVSKAYIIRYGLTQALNDAHAGIKSTETDAADKAAALVDVRLQQLLTGNPPSVSRGQTKPEWYIVAEGMVTQALKAKGIKKKDVDGLDGMVRKLYEIRKDTIDAEVERRKGLKSEGIDLASLGL